MAHNKLIAETVYREKYVLFLDILGFKSKVELADANPIFRSHLYDVLVEFRDTLCTNPRIDEVFTNFSDCIVVSTARNCEGLSEILYGVKYLARNLLSHRFLVRGGLAVGGVHHDHDFVYGVGVNKAYSLEQEASYPRTLISAEVMADIMACPGLPASTLVDPVDGKAYVNFLQDLALYRALPIYPGKELLEPFAKWIMNFILDGLEEYRCNDRVLLKYEWLFEYWNRTVASQNVFEGLVKGMPKYPDSECGQSILHRRILAR